MAIDTLAVATARVPEPAAERSRVWRKFVRNPAAVAGGLTHVGVVGAAAGADVRFAAGTSALARAGAAFAVVPAVGAVVVVEVAAVLSAAA